MDDLKAYFREGLIARVRALETAKSAFESGRDGAEDTIRRIAHSLHGAGGTYGFPEVSQAAALVEHASANDFSELLDTLLDVLRELSVTMDLRVNGLLVIEDDPVCVRMYERALGGRGRNLEFCSSREAAERVIEEQDISLVVLDLMLPGFDGRDFLTWVRNRPGSAELPVIVISAKSSTFVRAECVALGADEFFVKPVDLDELSVTVGARLQRYAEQSRQSRRDPLTGLANRAAAEEAFARALALHRRDGTDMSVAMIDLDRFKAVNDTYGHAAGDEVLKKTAETLSQYLRGSDFIARWGGEEFFVLFHGTRSGGARKGLINAAERFRDAPFAVVGGDEIYVTFSAGTADVVGADTLKDAAARADRLLYMAKAAGGQSVLAEEETSAPPRRKIVIAEDDELLAEMIRQLLVAEGHDVIVCSDGQEALSVAKSTRPSLMILDVDMPGMSGIDVLSEMKKCGFNQRVPIMMLTARSGDEDVVGAFDLGADDYMTKPFSPSELRARVRRYVTARKPATVH